MAITHDSNSIFNHPDILADPELAALVESFRQEDQRQAALTPEEREGEREAKLHARVEESLRLRPLFVELMLSLSRSGTSGEEAQRMLDQAEAMLAKIVLDPLREEECGFLVDMIDDIVTAARAEKTA